MGIKEARGKGVMMTPPYPWTDCPTHAGWWWVWTAEYGEWQPVKLCSGLTLGGLNVWWVEETCCDEYVSGYCKKTSVNKNNIGTLYTEDTDYKEPYWAEMEPPPSPDTIDLNSEQLPTARAPMEPTSDAQSKAVLAHDRERVDLPTMVEEETNEI